MLRKLKFLTLAAALIFSCAVFSHTVSALECSDGTTATDASSCPAAATDPCSQPGSQNTCAPTERIVATSTPPSSETSSTIIDEPPAEIITTASTPATVSSSSETVTESERSLWPMYLSLGALAFAVLLIMILNLCGRHRS